MPANYYFQTLQNYLSCILFYESTGYVTTGLHEKFHRILKYSSIRDHQHNVCCLFFLLWTVATVGEGEGGSRGGGAGGTGTAAVVKKHIASIQRFTDSTDSQRQTVPSKLRTSSDQLTKHSVHYQSDPPHNDPSRNNLRR